MPQNFFDMSNNYFTLTDASKSGHVQCGSKSFGGVDPVPGQVKGCYCDDKSLMYSEEET